MVVFTCKVKLGVLSFLNKNVSCGCNDFWRSSLKWGYQAQTVGLWNVRSGFYLMHIFHRHSESCFKAIKRWRSTSGTFLLMEYVLCFVSRNREQWIGSEEVRSRSVKCILWIGVCFAERMALQGLSFHFCLLFLFQQSNAMRLAKYKLCAMNGRHRALPSWVCSELSTVI